jgi:hypothetical protein
MKRITLAFDSFKGSFSSLEVAASFAEALRRHVGHCHIDMVEIADIINCAIVDPEGNAESCRERVQKLLEKYPLY